jgi:predicted transcriptional regulator
MAVAVILARFNLKGEWLSPGWYGPSARSAMIPSSCCPMCPTHFSTSFKFSVLAERGWSQRRIASELGINRETVGRYLRLGSTDISIAESEDRSDPKPAISITGIGAGRRSHCEPLAEVIASEVEVGLSARRIYQHLVEQNGFRES